MRALVQRVSSAAVTIEKEVVAEIGRGLLIFLGIRTEDTRADADFIARKVLNLRIFPDAEQKMNLSVIDTFGAVLIVSQFTLYGETRRGNRPSFSQAAKAEIARPLYEYFVNACALFPVRVAAGVFQAHMNVALVNDGPVTLLCDSESQTR